MFFVTGLAPTAPDVEEKVFATKGGGDGDWVAVVEGGGG